MVIVKADTHMRLLKFENEVLKSGKGFYKPKNLPFFNHECFRDFFVISDKNLKQLD